MHGLHINGTRLWDTVAETARFGAAAKGGVSRLTLTDADRQVRDWFVEACESIGCAITVDDMGNIFARRQGNDASLPPIAMGSHLDTQPSGGRFDGILGVLAGLEVLRTLTDTGWVTDAPLEVVNWTNEEGSRFAPSMLASGVFAGVLDRDFAYAREDSEGRRFGEELERIGYRGPGQCGDHRLGAYFELHIEQGPVLEAENVTLGVVTGAQAQRRYEARVIGQPAHAGTTPMHLRQDALLASARIVEEVNAIAVKRAPHAVSTVGMVEVQPNSRNVIPGLVRFSVDFRHPQDEVLRKMDGELRDTVDRVASEAGLKVELEQIWGSPAMTFDNDCVGIVQRAAEDLGHTHRRIVSGAGHDAVYVARVAPTAMVFIPCEGGISHSEVEKTGREQVAAGGDVLLRAVLMCDRRLGAI